MFTPSFGKDNRFLTSVSVRLRYLWSSIRAVPRQLTLRYRFFHNLPFSCDKLWLFLASRGASCCVSQHGSLPGNEEFLAVVNAAWNAHGYFSKYCHVDWKSSLGDFQKILFWTWHTETGNSDGGGARALGCRGVPVRWWVLSSCSRVPREDVQCWWHSLCAVGSSRQPLPWPRI